MKIHRLSSSCVRTGKPSLPGILLLSVTAVASPVLIAAPPQGHPQFLMFDGQSYNAMQEGAPTRITSVAEGTVASDSTDAVNGSQLHSITHDLSGLQNEQQALSDGLDALGGELTSVQSSLQQTNEQLGDLGTQVQAIDDRTGALSQQVGQQSQDMQSGFDNIDGHLAGVDDRLEGLEGNVSENSSAIEQLGGDAATTATRVDSLESGLDETQVGLNQLQLDLQDQGSAHAEKFAAVDRELTEVSSGVAGNSEAIGDVEQGLSQTQDRVTVLEQTSAEKEQAMAKSLESAQQQIEQAVAFCGQGGAARSVRCGEGAVAEEDAEDSIVLGSNARVNDRGAIAIGGGSEAHAAGSVAIGQNAVARSSVAVGTGSQATGTTSTAVGDFAVASGSQATALGNQASATGDNSVALGNAASATASNSVALGDSSVADRANTVSIGSAGAERQLTNVAAGTAPTDAVNVGQLDSMRGQLRREIEDLEKDTNAAIASVAAMEAAPYVAGRMTYALGSGYHVNQGAVGLTLRKTAESGNWSVSGGFAGSESSATVRLGVSGVLW